jgi:sulfate adenylyltransferase subunit 1
LLEALESVAVRTEMAHMPMRFPVQLVVRPGAGADFRGYAGRLESGTVYVGDEVLVLPANRHTKIRDIVTLEGSRALAVAGDPITLLLADEIDISRGDMIVPLDAAPQSLKSINATVCWLSAEGFNPLARYVLKHTSRIVKAKVTALNHKLDINSLEEQPAPSTLLMNDIAHISINLAQPIFVDAYAQNRSTGAFILIDETSNQTVAAGMVEA